MSFRRTPSSVIWRLGLGNPAFAISHGSRDTTALTPELTSLRWHAAVPFTFRIRVSHWTQEPSFEFLPAAPGIQQSASRRISLPGHPIPAEELEPDDARQGWGQAIEHGPRTTRYVIDLASNPAPGRIRRAITCGSRQKLRRSYRSGPPAHWPPRARRAALRAPVSRSPPAAWR